MSIYDIVDLVARHLLDGDAANDASEDILACSARSVCRLWRYAFDKHLLRAISYEDGLYHVAGRSYTLNVKVLIDDDPGKIRHIGSITSRILLLQPAYDLRDYSLLALCSNLHTLDLDAASLTNISAHARHTQALFPDLRMLYIHFPPLESLRCHQQRDNIAVFLDRFPDLEHLSISANYLPGPFTDVNIEEWIAMVSGATSSVRSLELRIRATCSDCTSFLSALFSVYSSIESLSLRLCHQKVDFRGLLPVSIKRLSIDTTSCHLPGVLAMLADKHEIPNLTEVPNVHRILWEYGISSQVTEAMIQQAILGLQRRNGIPDPDVSSHTLFRLLVRESMASSSGITQTSLRSRMHSRIL
jgi:hypothetical protein